MARWKLMTSHYLNCGDTQWEYKEVDRNTGREKRKQIEVPRFLDVRDPGDWTNRFGDAGISKGGSGPDGQGDIIVCHEGKGEPRDITFYGDPTPDMAPIDDEAKAISASFEDHWRYKPETAEISYSQSMIDKWEAEKVKADAAPPKVEIAGLSELVSAMAALTAQNQELMKGIFKGRL